ncbi:MAG: tRNA (guanosine(46)-N7)-methyltransferase TrmB [Neisseriaceae bacterium]|nr:tRNA (guanosine(46)-N7)-methyltransferase TrmB [Neisseriaceae bacterium]
MVDTKQEISRLRGIRSFVLRQGHLSDSQKRAIDALMPLYGVAYQNQLLDLSSLFGRSHDKILEIGFGMGVATAEIAFRQPEKDFLAIDVHTPGVGNLLKLIDQQKLSNLRVIHHDAVEVLRDMIADAALDGVHIFFPDPWHKKRHHKRRLIQPAFVDNIAQKVKVGGYIHLATDWEDYAVQMLEVLSASPFWKNTASSYADKPDYRPQTKFELRGKKLGHGVWDLIFQRI